MTDDTSDLPERPNGDAESDDVNEAAVADWIAERTPFERVHQVARRTYDPTSARRIGNRARVSPTTARKHLRALVDSGEVTTTEDGQTTLYARSETAIVTEHAESLLAERTTDEIASGIADMKSTIRAYREEYGVDSPEEFASELDVNDADSEHGTVLTTWQTTRRNLALAQTALAIAEASASGHLTDTDDDGDYSLVA